jgi:hypothetical protein
MDAGRRQGRISPWQSAKRRTPGSSPISVTRRPGGASNRIPGAPAEQNLRSTPAKPLLRAAAGRSWVSSHVLVTVEVSGFLRRGHQRPALPPVPADGDSGRFSAVDMPSAPSAACRSLAACSAGSHAAARADSWSAGSRPAFSATSARAASRMRVVVDGTFIWIPNHDQRPRSFPTALRRGYDPCQPGAAVGWSARSEAKRGRTTWTVDDH